MCNVDLPAQLHHALFRDTPGYILKPAEMRLGHASEESSISSEASSPATIRSSVTDDDSADDDGTMRGSWVEESTPEQHRATSTNANGAATTTTTSTTSGVGASTARTARSAAEEEPPAWPPARDELHHTTLELLSLHHLPSPGERRPCLDGRRRACHEHLADELSGRGAPPIEGGGPLSLPRLEVSLHPIGGFCAIGGALPLPEAPATRMTTPHARGSGLHARLGTTVHCVAAEPHSTFLRVAVLSAEGDEVPGQSSTHPSHIPDAVSAPFCGPQQRLPSAIP